MHISIEQAKNILKADWTPYVVESTYNSSKNRHNICARAKLVILGSAASLKDTFVHVALAIVNALKGHFKVSYFPMVVGNIRSPIPKPLYYVDDSGAIFSAKGANAQLSREYIQKAKMYALNIISTIFLGAISPERQMHYLNKHMPFALPVIIKAELQG